MNRPVKNGRDTRSGLSTADAGSDHTTVASGLALRVPTRLFEETFAMLRSCGRGREECQVLWLGPWRDPSIVTSVIHSNHHAHWGGFQLDNDWITELWLRLAARNEGIRAQVHTHPANAFHSATDDAWPVVNLDGFLSLVIPNFAMGPVTLDATYLAEIGSDGEFRRADVATRLSLI